MREALPASTRLLVIADQVRGSVNIAPMRVSSGWPLGIWPTQE